MSNTDFVLGDVVVITQEWCADRNELLEVEDITGNSIFVMPFITWLPAESRQLLGFCIHVDHIRHATSAELEAKSRLPISGMDLATGQDRTKVFVKSINMTKEELESAYAEAIEANIGVAAINADYLEEKLNLQSRIDEALKIVNEPANMYLMFSQVAGLLTEALIGEVRS